MHGVGIPVVWDDGGGGHPCPGQSHLPSGDHTGVVVHASHVTAAIMTVATAVVLAVVVAVVVMMMVVEAAAVLTNDACAAGRRGRGGGGILLALHLDLLLVQLAILGPAILEPDLDLALGQGEGEGELRLPPDRDVLGEVELLLQLHPLVVRVHDSILVPCPRLACWFTADHGTV